MLLLVKEEHDKLWEIVKGVLKGVVPEAGWKATEGKLERFKAAYGTVGADGNDERKEGRC